MEQILIYCIPLRARALCIGVVLTETDRVEIYTFDLDSAKLLLTSIRLYSLLTALVQHSGSTGSRETRLSAADQVSLFTRVSAPYPYFYSKI